jgi:hypothetical protein
MLARIRDEIIKSCEVPIRMKTAHSMGGCNFTTAHPGGNRIDLNRFLRIAIGLVAALGQVQRRVLIPRNRTILKSSFVLLW